MPQKRNCWIIRAKEKRTIINKALNEYWPNQNGTEARFMAYRFPATDWLAPTGEMMIADRVNDTLDEVWGTQIRIGTENEVINPKNWKR